MWTVCLSLSFRSPAIWGLFHPFASPLDSPRPSHPIPISHHAKPSRITGNSITLEDASSFESSSRLVGDSSSTEQPQEAIDEIHTLSFSELRALIEQGKTDGIPNNRLIPNILNVSSIPRSHHLYQPGSKPRVL